MRSLVEPVDHNHRLDGAAFQRAKQIPTVPRTAGVWTQDSGTD